MVRKTLTTYPSPRGARWQDGNAAAGYSRYRDPRRESSTTGFAPKTLRHGRRKLTTQATHDNRRRRDRPSLRDGRARPTSDAARLRVSKQGSDQSPARRGHRRVPAVGDPTSAAVSSADRTRHSHARRGGGAARGAAVGAAGGAIGGD